MRRIYSGTADHKQGLFALPTILLFFRFLTLTSRYGILLFIIIYNIKIQDQSMLHSYVLIQLVHVCVVIVKPIYFLVFCLLSLIAVTLVTYSSKSLTLNYYSQYYCGCSLAE